MSLHRGDARGLVCCESDYRFFRFLGFLSMRGSGPVSHQGSGGRTGLGSLGRSGVHGGRFFPIGLRNTPPVKMSEMRSMVYLDPVLLSLRADPASSFTAS